jgi:hypothetical protein
MNPSTLFPTGQTRPGYPDVPTALRLTHPRRIAASILVTVSLLVASCAGWAAPGVAIGLPAHGTELLQTSGFYDPANETVVVRGAMVGIPAGAASDYRVLLNGFGTIAAGGGGGIASFSYALPIGPLPPLGMAGWPSWVPYVNQFTNTEAILLPILAELYHIPSQTVVARSRVVLIDKRWDDDMNMHAAGALSDSLAFELTEAGIDALEDPHASSLPQPGLADFNDDLTSEFAGHTRALAPDTSFGSATKVCVGAEAEPMLTATAAYTNAFVDAGAAYGVYRAAKEACDNANPNDLLALLPGIGALGAVAAHAAACALKTTSCVRELPRNDRFEVCVGEVEGVGDSLAVANVQSVDLTLADYAAVEASNVLGRVDGTIDVTLKDLSIRWDVEHTGCSLRPERTMTETDRLSVTAVAAWSSCPALTADAVSAESLDVQAYTAVPGSNPETLDVVAGLAPDPLFELNIDRSTDVGTGTCSEDFVSADVERVLEDFYTPMREAVDATWDADNPATQQAAGLDLLLSRFETGHFGDMPDVVLDLAIHDIESAEDRLQGQYNSEAHIDPSEVVFANSEFVYSPPSGFPCTTNLFPFGGGCTHSTNYYGAPFDASYSLTTGMLNQVIGQRYGTSHLFRALSLSCDDIGLPVGCAPNDEPVLDGTTLASLHSAFAGLGATQVAIELAPTMVPFTWIHPDPPTVGQAGRADLTYQLGQYQVDFIGDLPGPDGTTLWLSLIVDFFAPGLELDVARAQDSNKIAADLGENRVWHYTIVKSQLAGCPLIPRTNLPAGYVPPPCEGDVTAAISGLVEPVLAEALHALVSQHPAPQMFDAFGEASRAKQFDQTDRFQDGQVITLYGDLVD